jgi:20S proteasome alpha/beta subunit
MIKLFIVSTTKFGYDDYDSLVIAAIDRKEAIKIASTKLPGAISKYKTKIIGEAKKGLIGIIHESFNAG